MTKSFTINPAEKMLDFQSPAEMAGDFACQSSATRIIHKDFADLGLLKRRGFVGL
jgi:hypothetical protein